MIRILASFVFAATGIVASPVWGQKAIAPAATPEWTISDARSVRSRTVLEFSVKTGKMQWRNVSDDESILQVIALVDSPIRTVGPIRFSDITIRNQPAGGAGAARDFALLSVGTWNNGCNYLDGRDMAERRKVAVTLGSGDQFSISNISGSKLQFAVTARRMQICLAFVVPKSMAGNWFLRAGKFEIPVAQGLPAVAAQASTMEPLAAAGQLKIQPDTANVGEPSSRLQGDGFATSRNGWVLAVAAALLLAIAALFGWRRVRPGQPVGEQFVDQGKMPVHQVIPTLSEPDLPTAYATLEDQPGPGAAMLSAASRAMQSEDFVSAGDSLRQAIELGLEPGHLSRARLSLAEVALIRGDLLTAIREYRQCLCGSRPIVRAVLPAATNLALIYRKLGMRGSAKLAERVVAAASISGEVLHPARVQQIGQLASALKWSMRTKRLRSLFPWTR